MSAFKYLVFVIGVILVAVFGAILNEFVTPAIEMAESQSTTEASATGIQWFADFWDVIPIVAIALLSFALLVAIVVRRNRTARI